MIAKARLRTFVICLRCKNEIAFSYFARSALGWKSEKESVGGPSRERPKKGGLHICPSNL